MHDNRNSSPFNSTSDCKGTVCIDTRRILDSCRDRDCYEDTRVYLTSAGEEIIANATSVRTKYARTLWAFVGLSEVPFNCGFYQISIRYYVEIEVEACLGLGRSQCVKGLAILDKDVILFGGEGTVTTFTSGPENTLCSPGGTSGSNAPVAVLETVEPVVLSTKVCQPECQCCTCNCECVELPETVCGLIDGDLVNSTNGPKLLVSLGIFSVIRIERPAQLLVQGTDYSVPDKECTAGCGNESPCELFRNMAFPTARFRGNTCCEAQNEQTTRGNGGCGCGKGN